MRWPDFLDVDLAGTRADQGPVIVEGRNTLAPYRAREPGLRYQSIGAHS